MTEFVLRTSARVVAVVEHSRTIRGRHDPVTGQAYTEQVKMGWFIHLLFEGNTGTISFGVGDRKPRVSVGDTIYIDFMKALPQEDEDE